MKSHFTPHPAQHLALPAGVALQLAHGGDIEVAEGTVWLTRHGDPKDHVLRPGQRFRLSGLEGAVIESWHADRAASVRWQPRAHGLVARAVAAALAALAGRLAALARSAASSASRAQGCVHVGDSIAASGAMK